MSFHGDVFTGRVLSWQDGGGPTLNDELRSRPGIWAVVATRVHSSSISYFRGQLYLDIDLFEVHVRATDDGEYGPLYEIAARYVGEDGEHLPEWERED